MKLPVFENLNVNVNVLICLRFLLTRKEIQSGYSMQALTTVSRHISRPGRRVDFHVSLINNLNMLIHLLAT